jgi:palmitoyltransferase
MGEFEEVTKLVTLSDLMAKRPSGATADSDPFQVSTWCKLCDAPKPPRAHHCHVTNRCVLLMDHYCPWVANTVGFFNYRFFYLFMFWLWVGAVYIVLITYLPFRAALEDRTMPGRAGITFSFVCAVAIFFALGGMLGWQTFLIATAQTTVEFYHNRVLARRSTLTGHVFRNPFDLGLRRNWDVIFGPSSFLLSWALPTAPGPVGNGVQWPTLRIPDPVYVEVDTSGSAPQAEPDGGDHDEAPAPQEEVNP